MLRVALERPLGSRQVIEKQFGRQQPVFDGARLAELTWLPNGWRSGLEVPAGWGISFSRLDPVARWTPRSPLPGPAA